MQNVVQHLADRWVSGGRFCWLFSYVVDVLWTAELLIHWGVEIWFVAAEFNFTHQLSKQALFLVPILGSVCQVCWLICKDLPGEFHPEIWRLLHDYSLDTLCDFEPATDRNRFIQFLLNEWFVSGQCIVYNKSHDIMCFFCCWVAVNTVFPSKISKTPLLQSLSVLGMMCLERCQVHFCTGFSHFVQSAFDLLIQCWKHPARFRSEYMAFWLLGFYSGSAGMNVESGTNCC